MKKVATICLLAILICTMIVPAFVPAFAEENTGTNGYNVVIAMDSSGSLKDTDPNNYRYSAMNLFIQLLKNNSNKLGCLSFSSNVSNQKKLETVKGVADKQAVYGSLTSTDIGGWTNIGEALQAAVDDIKANQDKSLPSVILFFSDGNTEMSTDKETQASLEAKADAVQDARDNGIAIYSICLNADGKADRKEMEQVSKATGGKFVEIKKAEDLQNALTTFYSMIYGSSVKTIVDNTFDSNGRIEVPFTVPGVGVDEINIIIYGKAKDIETKKPDNTTAKSDIIDAETFSFLKIEDTMPGEWSVALTGVPGDKVKIDLLFNTDLSISTSVSPDESVLNPDDVITFNASLHSNKDHSEAKNKYSGFEATLNLLNPQGENVKEYPMSLANDHFTVETNLEEGIYKYSVTVRGFNIERTSEVKGPITISTEVDSQAKIANQPPVPVEEIVEVKINIWPFKENMLIQDVSSFATDDQEEPLIYKLSSTSFVEGEDYSFDGQTLQMNHFSLSKGDFVFTAYDKFGESCDINLRIKTRNIGLITVILIAVIAIAVIVALIVVAKIASGKPFMGEVTVMNLNSYQTATQRKNRGKIKITAFLIGNTGINNKSYFQATGKNYVYFISKVPVESDMVVGKSKKIKIENGFETRIYSDAQHDNGIEVRFNSFVN